MHLLAFCILWESLLIALCAQFRSLERDDGNISITYIAFVAKKNIRNRSLNRVYTSPEMLQKVLFWLVCLSIV